MSSNPADPRLPSPVGRKPRRFWLAAPFRFASPCAGFEPFVPVRPSELPPLGLDCFSAKGSILDPLQPAQRALAFHPEDSLFDVVVEAADAIQNDPAYNQRSLFLNIFMTKSSHGAMAQTRRTGIRNERAQLAKAPRFSPYRLG